MIPKNFKTLGLKDMHPMQVSALTELIGITLNLASLTEDSDIVEDTEHFCDELIKLFGGQGVQVTIEIDL